MKYILLFLFACSPDRKGEIEFSVDSTGRLSGPTKIEFVSLGGVYCCDTVRTLNHTAIVKSVIDASGNLTGFEIVKVLK